MTQPGEHTAGKTNVPMACNARRPLIVGIGGTTRPASSSERAVRVSLAAAEAAGADTRLFVAAELMLPMYAPERPDRTPEAVRLVDTLANADGLIISSPCYHGGISGLLKNALDYVEDLRDHDPPYLDGRAVACIACGAGTQAPAATLVALRTVVHALRGWPTPLGVAINSARPVFAPNGTISDPGLQSNLETLGNQVVEFARGQRALASAPRD